MHAQNNSETRGAATAAQRKPFGELRPRNTRRASVAQVLEAQRRQRVERVMQVTRQRRFRQSG